MIFLSQVLGTERLCTIELPTRTLGETFPFLNKKAELPQRLPRDAPYIWCPENFRDPKF